MATVSEFVPTLIMGKSKVGTRKWGQILQFYWLKFFKKVSSQIAKFDPSQRLSESGCYNFILKCCPKTLSFKKMVKTRAQKRAEQARARQQTDSSSED